MAKNIYIRRVGRIELKSSSCHFVNVKCSAGWWMTGFGWFFSLRFLFFPAAFVFVMAGGPSGASGPSELSKATSGSHISTVTNLFTLNWSTLTSDQEHMVTSKSSQSQTPTLFDVDSTKLRIV